VANKIQLIIEADDQASSKFKKIVAGLEKGLSSTDTETKKLTRSTSELGSTLKWAGALLGTYFGVRAIRGIGDALLDTGLKTDRFAAGLKGALGTVEAAGEAMDWLRDVSDELGLVFENQVGAFQKLAAAARGTALEGQGARDIFLAVSEAATAMQLSADETNGALYAISQMMSKGTVAAEELRGQLGERLPGAFQIAARSMGITTQELNKMLEQGKVISEDFLPKFARQLHKELGGAAKDAADTTERNLNRLTNEWFQIKADIADDVMPIVNETIQGLLDTIKRLEQEGTLKAWAEGISTVMGGVVKAASWAATAISDLFGKSLEFQLWQNQQAMKAVNDEIGRLEERLKDIPKVIQPVGEGLASVGNDAEVVNEQLAETRSEFEKLESEQDGLLGKILELRSGFGEISTTSIDVNTNLNTLTTTVTNQKDAFKELDQQVKDWNETYNAYLEKIGEERGRAGDFGKLFGVETLFPTQEEWDEYREVYDENLEAIGETNAVHYEGLTANAVAYLENLKREHEKAGKAITKDDAINQKILQQQALQTANLQMQTGQLVAQTMIAISGEEHGALFYMARAFATVQAIINAWLAYTNALANIPPPANVPIAKWTLASGLAAAALIGAQTFVGKQKGGWLEGGSGTRDDLYIGTVGQTAFLAQGGEFIVNKQAAQENAGLLEDINAGKATTVQASTAPIVLHSYITLELEGERLGEYVDERVYESSKAGRRIVHSRGIVS